MEQLPKIKPCPFCRQKADLVSELVNEPDYFAPLYQVFVECTFCEARGKAFLSKKDAKEYDYLTYECVSAVTTWNTRPDEKTPVIQSGEKEPSYPADPSEFEDI